MQQKQHSLSLHHRHANPDGVVETVTEGCEAKLLDAALARFNRLLANPVCRNWGCRIELDGQVITYTLTRDNCAAPGPVRFCDQDAHALARERNASLQFATAWRVDRILQVPSRTAARAARISGKD